jgi:hypothetical protein
MLDAASWPNKICFEADEHRVYHGKNHGFVTVSKLGGGLFMCRAHFGDKQIPLMTQAARYLRDIIWVFSAYLIPLKFGLNQYLEV